MSRLRVTFTTAALLLALAALTLNSLAQPPGRGGGAGGGGGGRGGRGGGPGGGFGGPGGPGGGFGGPGGGSLLQLASNSAVQADMKVTEKQKTQIKSLNDKYNARMQEFWGQMGGPGGRGQGGGGPQGQGQGRGRNGNGGNGQNGQGQVGNGQGGNGGGGGGNRGNRGNRNQNGQGIPEDPEVAQQRAEQREMMREAMAELRQSAETSLGRILEKGQATRLKQIQLQLEGPTVVLREDMMEKLGIDEAQVEMIREIQGENRNLQRETRRSRGDIMKTAFAKMNPAPRNNGQDGGDGAIGGGGNNGNGNNGRNGGGRGGRGNFDPEAMRKVMEAPEIKAQMDQIQSQEQKLATQFSAAVNKVLSPRQKAMFKKMLGPPFDRAQMGGGGPWGGRGGFGPGGNQAATKGAAAAKAKASDDNDDDETPKAKAATAAPAKAKATTPKRKSLREQRGEAPADDN
jgi:hypothetical protein